jgi:glucose/mannose-6-phosphate isomerase
MLDDLKYIHEKDAQDALGIAEKQWQQIEYDYNFTHDLDFSEILNIVFAGMGGSALAALISTSWPGYNRPFEICRNYNLPGFVGEKTLVIVSSYSGNTEETISALYEAESKGAKIVVISDGGHLVDIANEKNIPLIILPKASQPRFAVFYGLKALVSLLVNTKLLDSHFIDELNSCGEFLKDSINSWLPTVHSSNNLAKKIALDVIGKSPVVYSGPKMAPAGYKWKISFNENAKTVAWFNQYPEFNHNEFIGWTSHPIDKPYAVIDLRSNLEHARIQKRFEVTERLLSGKRPAPIVVNIEGDSLIKQLLWCVALGDFVTLYTGLLNGLNPTPVELIEKFKAELG